MKLYSDWQFSSWTQEHKYQYHYLIHYLKGDNYNAKIIKSSVDNSSLSLSSKINVNFIKMINNLISHLNKEKKEIFFVLPPHKNGRNQGFAWLTTHPEYKYFNFILIKSDDYTLKKKSKDERKTILENVSKNWECTFDFTVINKDSTFIFIDDILTSGLTALYVQKWILKNVEHLDVKNDFFMLTIARTITDLDVAGLLEFKPAYNRALDIEFNGKIGDFYKRVDEVIEFFSKYRGEN